MGWAVHGVWGGVHTVGRDVYGAEGPWGSMPMEGVSIGAGRPRGGMSKGWMPMGWEVPGARCPWGSSGVPPNSPPQRQRSGGSALRPRPPTPQIGAGRRQVVNGDRDGRKMLKNGGIFLKS